ncbi:hypothetical protein HYFRA_00001945 [Hymenoscyphus fraxineus]|uniref:Uncharacterized protein n=1 Tax=Hymenoscyphus fraxineus TaxID=746836 RepID=A0A9N9KNQ0_9HELO|nr:hypothetical protein HYFRA_00001945 [Hymenoscyphus fraxineus]
MSPSPSLPYPKTRFRHPLHIYINATLHTSSHPQTREPPPASRKPTRQLHRRYQHYHNASDLTTITRPTSPIAANKEIPTTRRHQTTTLSPKDVTPPQSLRIDTTFHTLSNVNLGPLGFSSQSLRERSIRPSMARYLRPVARNEEDEEVDPGDTSDTSEGFGSALRRMRRERRGSERARYEDEDEKEDFHEEEIPTQPPTPRLIHLDLVPPSDSNSDLSPITNLPTPTIPTPHIPVARPKYSSAFEGRRLASSTRTNKREPLKVVTPPSRSNAQKAKELVKSKKEFRSYLQSLRKRVEVLERGGGWEIGGEVMNAEMEMKKVPLHNRRSHTNTLPPLPLPHHQNSATLLQLQHINFSSPSWLFGDAGSSRIRALLEASDDRFAVLINSDSVDGRVSLRAEMEERIRGLVGEGGNEHEMRNGDTRKYTDEEIEPLDLGVSVADDEGDWWGIV